MHAQLLSHEPQPESSLGNVTAAVSRGLHDMAQPLTMLSGLLELALLRQQTASELRMTVEVSLDQAGRAIAILNSVRELVSGQAPAKSVSNLAEGAAQPGSGKVQACQPR